MHADDFKRALREIRAKYLREHGEEEGDGPDVALGSDHIKVYVRKRPLLPHELEKHEFDVISAVGKREIVIHECKMYNGALYASCLVEEGGSWRSNRWEGRYAAQVHYLAPPAILNLLR